MKLIDWAKVPRGTMTNYGEVLLVKKSTRPYAIVFEEEDCRDYSISNLRIVPQTRWTYHDGGECPVPEGLTFEVLYPWVGYRHIKTSADNIWGWSEVFAYRSTGVDRNGGWTDCPDEATE
jgi:hypothetical protein